MDVTEILTMFTSSESIHFLSFSEKMTGVLVTIILGMGITFAVLVIIQYLIGVMSLVLSKLTKETVKIKTESRVEEDKTVEEKKRIAAITAVMEQVLGDNKQFRIKSITKL